MDDYISRKAAIEAVKHAWAKGLEPTQYIEEICAANVREDVQGEWEDVFQDGPCCWSGKCSVCGVRNDIPPLILAHFCPNCGARMDGGDLQ